MSSDEKSRFALVPVSCSADCDFESNILATYGIEAKLFSNVCIRSLNSIYYNAPRVKPGDESDFAGYCLSSLAAICGHQENAEKILFPVLQKKYDMAPFAQQYASYRDHINALNEYLKSVAAKGAYDGQKVRELLDSFGDELAQTFLEGVCISTVVTTSLSDIFFQVKSIDYDRLKEYDENEIKEMLQGQSWFHESIHSNNPISSS